MEHTEPKKRVLIVDDDIAISSHLKYFLELKGCEVETAATGREAIEKSARGVFDVALLDIKLPDMDGTELLTKLHDRTPKMIKIMVTGYPTLENAKVSIKMGADAYVLKPINPNAFLKMWEEKTIERQSPSEVLTTTNLNREWLADALKTDPTEKSGSQ
jgi:DNA-binding NtrC family response regulator